LRLRPHPARQALRIILFKSGGIDNQEIKAQQVGLTLSTVSRYARAVVDQRQTLSNEPIEQR
jgi:hypothetical protein